MRLLTALAASAALLSSVGTASAAVIWATGWNDLIAGENGPGDADAIPARTNPNNALGAPDGTAQTGYFSPGIGGQIDFVFGGKTFGGNNTAVVYEVTIGNIDKHVETADVFAVNTFLNTVDFIGSIINSGSQNGVTLNYSGGPFNEVRVADTSCLGTTYSASNDTGVTECANGSFDGFDIDAIGVSPIPLPAAGLLLLGGLGGLAGVGAVRRKKD